MSEQIEWQPGAKFIHIVCRLGMARADGEDPDALPDLMTQGGTVKLTCSVDQIRYAEADGRRRMLTISQPWEYKIRASDGELFNPSTGQLGENVLSGASEGTDPAEFWWTAEVFPETGGSFRSVVPPLGHGVVFDLVDGADVLPPGTAVSTLSARITALEEGGAAVGLGELADVDTGGAAPGDVLGYVDGGWAPVEQTGGGGAVSSVNGETGAVTLDAADVGAAAEDHSHTLADITDIDASGAAEGQVLTADGEGGAAWAEGGGGGTTWAPHTHQISDVTGLQAALNDTGGVAVVRESPGTLRINPSASTRGLLLLLGENDPVPNGTAAGTIIVRSGVIPPDPPTEPAPPVIVTDTLTTSRGTGAYAEFDTPAGTAAGDLLIAVIHHQYPPESGWHWESIDPGWETLAHHPPEEWWNLRNTAVLGLKVTDPATLPTAWTFQSRSGEARYVGIMARVTGVDLADPVAAVGPAGTDSGNSATLPAVAAPAGSLALAAFVGQASSGVVDQFPTSADDGFGLVHEVASTEGLSETRSSLSLHARTATATTGPVTCTWPEIGSPAGILTVLRGGAQ